VTGTLMFGKLGTVFSFYDFKFLNCGKMQGLAQSEVSEQLFLKERLYLAMNVN
jgi:hypothetical protein